MYMRQHNSYKVQIHKEALNVLKVDVDDLLVDLIWESLWEKKRDQGSNTQQTYLSISHGLYIPANFFLYNLPQAPSVFFGTLSLKNEQEFKAFVQAQSNWSYQEDDTVNRLSTPYFLALQQGDKLALALFMDPGDKTSWIEKQLLGILENENQIALSESPFKEQMDQRGHLNLLGKYPLRVDFKKGTIRLAMNEGVEEVQISEAYRKGYTGFMQIALSDQMLKSKPEWKFGPFTLNSDSLSKYGFRKGFLAWQGSTIQQDKVVDYTYDEDFNPIAVTDTVERHVPAISGAIEVQSVALEGYLAQVGILDTVSQQISNQAFPLFTLYSFPINPSQLSIGSVIGSPKPMHTLDSLPDNSGWIYLDLKEILSIPGIPEQVKYYLSAGASLELKGQVQEGGRWSIHGEVHMQESTRNSLLQLLE